MPISMLNAPAAGPGTVLIVDDMQDARRLIGDVLHPHGYTVLEADGAQTAEPMLNTADIVLLDAMMAGVDGWTFCSRIKANYGSVLPVILITAQTDPGSVVRAFESGADDYLPKPFHPAELRARIETRLRMRRAEIALYEMNDRLQAMYSEAQRLADERELLLREIDHRVRNNFAMMSSLILLERKRHQHEETVQALLSVERRLRSFILVHEALRQGACRGAVLRETLKQLVLQLKCALDPNDLIDVQFTCPFTSDHPAIPEKVLSGLALVLNELVTNAFRHGFQHGQRGRLCISLSMVPNGWIELLVRDNGRGMPLPPDEKRQGGLSIIQAIVRGELRGKIEYLSADRGVHVRVTFPLGLTDPSSFSSSESTPSSTSLPNRR